MPSPQAPAAPLVLCLGEALVDRLEPPDGDRLGGAPANVACALARLGTPSAYLGRLGRDAIGEAFAAEFAERRVDTSALQWDAQRPSYATIGDADLISQPGILAQLFPNLFDAITGGGSTGSGPGNRGLLQPEQRKPSGVRRVRGRSSGNSK